MIYAMKEISIEELKQLQLDILLQVRNFCNKNGLKYFLAYGTLLGAIRHKGYIPWDDDIDIMMPRRDYDIFLRTFNGHCPSLVVYAPELNSNYYAPYANVCDSRTVLNEPYLTHKGFTIGVKIDIFPLDFVPSDDSEYERICAESKRLNNIRNIKISNPFFYGGIDAIKLCVKKALCSLQKYKKIQHRIMTLATESAQISEMDVVDVIVFITIPNRRFSKAVIEDSVDVEFEKEFFKAPAEYDTCLRSLFGNYMELPPIEKRVAHHNFKAYWK